MELAPDWLSVVNLCLTAFLGWKTLGPRRKTKLKLMLSQEQVGLNGEDGYRALIVLNKGHYPARGVKLENDGMTLGAGDILPWQDASAGIRLRNYELEKFLVSYLDADNKLTRKRLSITPGYLWSKKYEDEKATSYVSKQLGSKEERKRRRKFKGVGEMHIQTY